MDIKEWLKPFDEESELERTKERLGWLQNEHNKIIDEAFNMQKRIDKLEKALKVLSTYESYNGDTFVREVASQALKEE